MSIFRKTVDLIEHADLQAMIGTPESAILEYKRAVHDWDDIIKGLDAFANTFGGYLVLGAEGDRSGRLTGLPGVDAVSGFEQKIVDLCLANVVPPFTPFASPAIPIPSSSRVLYVVHTPASFSGPHFLAKRGGAYVRVGEHSKKYEPRLAEWNELAHLAERRERAIELRTSLLERARLRADAVLPGNEVLSESFIGPAYPTVPILELRRLREIANDPDAPARKINRLWGDPLSLPESFAYARPTDRRQDLYYELTINGSLYAAAPMGRVSREIRGGAEHVPLVEVLGQILLWLRQSHYVLQRIGYEGPVYAWTALRRIRGRAFVWSSIMAFSRPDTWEPRFDDFASQETEITTATMADDLGSVVLSIFIPIATATGMQNILDQDMDSLIKQAEGYLR